MLNRTIKSTDDGSKTIYINGLNESYHSAHGALAEAEHVFIDNGFKLVNHYEINILELGFGTGLNVLVTLAEFLKNDKNHIVNYFSLEKYPVQEREIAELGYGKLFRDARVENLFTAIHAAEWNIAAEIYPGFALTKLHTDFYELKNITLPPVHLVYFDCFGARVQPDLWEEPLAKMVVEKLCAGGLLTTYSSKGSFRRVLESLNFSVVKKPGPKGKREMINAIYKG